MEILDVVRKLVGEIEPVGDSREDEKRFESLKVMTKLVDDLLTDIDRVSCDKDRYEASRNKAGKYASDFLDRIGICD